MKTSYPKLVLFSSDSPWLHEFQERASSSAHVSAAFGNGPHVTAEEKLDAIWLTTMQASYFGASPPFPSKDGRVYEMPAERRSKGLPPLFVTGELPLDPSSTPERTAESALEMMLSAVSRFNQSAANVISRIGSLPENLGLESVDPAKALAIVLRVYAKDQGRT